MGVAIVILDPQLAEAPADFKFCMNFYPVDHVGIRG